MKLFQCDICRRKSDNPYYLVFKDRNFLQIIYSDFSSKLKKIDMCEKCFDIYIANMQAAEIRILEQMQEKKGRRKIISDIKKMSIFRLLWDDIKGKRWYDKLKK